jgi:Flp pilus assembly protein TadG
MRDRLAREDGQVVPLLAAGLLVVLLGFAALVVDLGHAYLVKRQLQSTADAAALAAADALPDAATALDTAVQFGPAHKNPVPGVGVQQTTSAWCLKSLSYCYGKAPRTAVSAGNANGVVVTESAGVPTTFAKLFGIDSINVSAKSTACGVCAVQPLDIALVLDRTGSMQGNMTDLKNGVRTFLQSLDPKLDYVTLLALPPGAGSDRCGAADTNVLYTSDDYLLVPIGNDYKTAAGSLNESSSLVSTVNCLQPGGATSYKPALVAAQDQLVNHGSGRADVQRVIVFESDGAANTVPLSYGGGLLYPDDPHRDDVLRPCGSAVDYASSIKAAGTLVFTVAYAVGQDDDCYQALHFEQVGGRWTLVGYRSVREAISAGPALSAIASPGDAVSQANQGDMSASFQQIATKLLGAKLVPDGEAG